MFSNSPPKSKKHSPKAKYKNHINYYTTWSLTLCFCFSFIHNKTTNRKWTTQRNRRKAIYSKIEIHCRNFCSCGSCRTCIRDPSRKDSMKRMTLQSVDRKINPIYLGTNWKRKWTLILIFWVEDDLIFGSEEAL